MDSDQRDAIYDDLLAEILAEPAEKPVVVDACALDEGAEYQARFLARVPVPAMRWYWRGNVWAEIRFPDVTTSQYAYFQLSLLNRVEDQSDTAFYLGP